MGIQGLMSYMLENDKFLFDPYQLHGGFLVIDGSNLASLLYMTIKESCAFGGDYDRFAQVVSSFIDDLSRCKVTPIVIGDGGIERKKLRTCFKRTRQVMERCMSYAHLHSTDFVSPPALISVFYETLKRKGVKVYQCMVDGDSSTAGLAKILDCPVLSYDSDFFIFGVKFIPFTMLRESVPKNNGYAKDCKIFRPENLLKMLPGFDRDVLPLAAVLLGNDFIDANIFSQFINNLQLKTENNNVDYGYWRHKQIHAVFQWLTDCCLDEAIKSILEELPPSKHSQIIKIIEEAVKDYLILPYKMIADLDLEKECDQEVSKLHKQKLSAFKRIVDSFKKTNMPADNCNVQHENITEKVVNFLPPWFRKEYIVADLPKYFISLVDTKIYFFWNHVENFDKPSVHWLSYDILGVIHGLLVARQEEIDHKLIVTIREGRRMVFVRFEEPVESTSTVIFPTLEELRGTDMKIRKRIIDETLEVTGIEEVLKDIPPRWRLYFAVLHFWIRNSMIRDKNRSHVCAILVSMLFNVIDEKIGYERSLENFETVHCEALLDIQEKRENSLSENSFDSLEDALEAVTREDCILAASFFISHFAKDERIINCPLEFDVNVVHVFTEFQCLCTHVLYLNMLLGRPYENISFSKLFNGTLLYNFYKKFVKQDNPYEYVIATLRQSPSLLNVIKLLFDKMLRINGFLKY